MNLDSKWIFLVAPALVSSYLTLSFVYSYRTDISLRANCSQFLFGSDEEETISSTSSSKTTSLTLTSDEDKELFELQQLKYSDQLNSNSTRYRYSQQPQPQQQQQQQHKQQHQKLSYKRYYQFRMADDSNSSTSGVAIPSDEMDLENTLDFSSDTTTTTTTSTTSTTSPTTTSSTTPTATTNSTTIPTLDSLSDENSCDSSEVKLPIRFGIGELQGRRPYMEDRSTAVLGFGVGDANTATRCFFGVFDGHGGDAASSWCKQKMHTNLAKQPDFPDNLPNAMRSALLQTDREFLSKFPKSSLDDGSTVIFAVLELHSSRLVVANAGDSRGVLSRSGVATPLSDDHKPDRPDERARVESHGGMVQQASLFGKFMGPYRVYTRVRTGGLAVSRGLGDGLLKQNDLVIAEPDIVDIHLAPGDEFMVLATDGVWDVFSNQQVVDFVRRFYLDASKDPTEVADLLVREAIQRGSLDNVTAIVVFFDTNQQFTGEPPLPETNVSRLTLQEQKVISFTKSV